MPLNKQMISVKLIEHLSTQSNTTHISDINRYFAHVVADIFFLCLFVEQSLFVVISQKIPIELSFRSCYPFLFFLRLRTSIFFEVIFIYIFFSDIFTSMFQSIYEVSFHGYNGIYMTLDSCVLDLLCGSEVCVCGGSSLLEKRGTIPCHTNGRFFIGGILCG